MESEFAYMACVVAIGALLTYLARAIPFLLFARRTGPLPTWVERFGAVASPVIIAALVVYSYTGLKWRTPWPYLAGALTVAVHLWRRNPLVSILSGTALYMVLVAGCASAPTGTLEYSAAKPLIRVSNNGILFNGFFVEPKDVPVLLERHRIPKDAVIHILVDRDFNNTRALWVFQHNYLNRAGYSRSILVHERTTEARTVERRSEFHPPQQFHGNQGTR